MYRKAFSYAGYTFLENGDFGESVLAEPQMYGIMGIWERGHEK
jgi:hypothetical protein